MSDTIPATEKYRGRLPRIRELVEDPDIPCGHRSTVHLWIRQGHLRARKVAGSTVIDGDSLCDLLAGKIA